MEDIASKATKTGCAVSRFLTPAEAQRIKSHFKGHRHTELSFDGGIEDAERVRAVFVNPNWGEFDRTTAFTALKAVWRSQDSLTHRDILGALMALGIERDTLGDIICEDHSCTLICLPELSGYISSSLTKAGRVGIAVSEVSLDELPSKQENLVIKTVSVASLRLDVLLCAAFGFSRTKASALITGGRVSLNHSQCLQPAKDLVDGSLLSVRGFGRAKLLEVSGTSRKGRIFVQLGLYSK